MHFLTAFHGNVVIVNKAYLEYTKPDNGVESDDSFYEDESVASQTVMMFQLVGIPTLNQKAREVKPQYTSLSTSGLYLILCYKSAFFWIGQDYFVNYLDENTYNKSSCLISETLQTRLNYLYEEAVDEEVLERRYFFEIEGRESNKFCNLFLEKEEDDYLGREFLKFESKYLRNTIVPQNPRLFCLAYKKRLVEYEEEDDAMKGIENPSALRKEIHNFKQFSLDKKGIYLLDFGSEAFIWVGKKVESNERLYAFQLGYQVISLLRLKDEAAIEKVALSQIEDGYEPEVFKQCFGDWQNYDIGAAPVEAIEESDEDSDEEEKEEDKKEGEVEDALLNALERTQSKKAYRGPSLQSEDFWY